MFCRSLSFLFLIISCVINLLCVLSLSSCWVNHERVFEHAIEYDGVLVEDPTVHYMHEGKPYRRGVRVNWRWTRDSSWSSFGENIIGPSYWKRTAVPGSESAVYCRELVKGEYGMRYHPDSAWQEATFPMNRARKDPLIGKSYAVNNREIDDSFEASAHLTWRGLYALPTAAVLFVVETPVNLVTSVYYLIKYS